MDNKKYQDEDGIILFVREVLGVDPTSYQEKILRLMVRESTGMLVSLPRAVGKATLRFWYNEWTIR